MAATIRDIRKYTGLSLATISKYLNGGNVLDKNKKLIEEAIEELDYEVNELARGLVTKRTNVIGVLVNDISCLYVGHMLHYLGIELRSHGYGMMICNSVNDQKTEMNNLQFLLSKKVDGLIIFPVGLDAGFLELAQKAEKPIVLVDRALHDANCDCVEIDNRDATFKITRQLLSAGHTKIALIASDVEYTGVERRIGFESALHQAGLTLRKEYTICGSHSFELGYEGMKKLIALPDRPTAAFLSNYETMLGAITALNESGLNCPEDISIAGFDDLLVSQVVKPKPWMVSQPMQKMCSEAVKLLLGRLSGELTGEPVRLVFDATILEGNTIKNINADINTSYE